MGNTQSISSKSDLPKGEWKVFKIMRREKCVNFVKLFLNEEVSFKNGNSNRIDFDSFGGTDLGNYVVINLEKTRSEGKFYTFSIEDDKLINLYQGQKKDSDGNIITDVIGIFGWAEDIARSREVYQAQVQDARFIRSTQGWTSYDMPPRW